MAPAVVIQQAAIQMLAMRTTATATSTDVYTLGQRLWDFTQIAIPAVARYRQSIRAFALLVGIYRAMPNGLLLRIMQVVLTQRDQN